MGICNCYLFDRIRTGDTGNIRDHPMEVRRLPHHPIVALQTTVNCRSLWNSHLPRIRLYERFVLPTTLLPGGSRSYASPVRHLSFPLRHFNSHRLRINGHFHSENRPISASYLAWYDYNVTRPRTIHRPTLANILAPYHYLPNSFGPWYGPQLPSSSHRTAKPPQTKRYRNSYRYIWFLPKHCQQHFHRHWRCDISEPHEGEY